jgi:hypothetical protein
MTTLRACRDWLTIDHPVPGWIVFGGAVDVAAFCFKAITRLTT